MLLEELGTHKLLSLTEALKEENAWRDVVKLSGLNLIPSADGLITALCLRKKTVGEIKSYLHQLKLQNALNVFANPETLQIVQQPFCPEGTVDSNGHLWISEGAELHLKVHITGSPVLSFQWFQDNELVSLNEELIRPNFSVDMQGHYRCTVCQVDYCSLEKRCISDDITVKMKVFGKPPQIKSVKPLPQSSSKCVAEHGKEFSLEVVLKPGATAKFCWWHESQHLDTYDSHGLCASLNFKEITERNAGTYQCHIKNRYGENQVLFEVEVQKKQYPSEKRALVISNSSYEGQPLTTPHNDNDSLCKCLKELYGFQCTSRKDLTAAAMADELRKFFGSLRKRAYVVFYFGGHGFINRSTMHKYMLGVDWQQGALGHVSLQLLEDVQEREPLLFMPILDMCQNALYDLPSKPCESVNQTSWNCNVVWCNATSKNRFAYEVPGIFENSVYMKHLQNVMRENPDDLVRNQIHDVHERVHTEKGEQLPEVHFILPRSDIRLSDPVLDLIESD